MSSFYKPKVGGVGRKFDGNRARGNMYDHAWEKYRLRFLEENPRCYCCGERATVVDHLIPHKGDSFLFKKLDNHIPLCKKDHDTVTGLFDMKYKVGSPVTGKIQFMSWARARRELTFRIKVLPFYEEIKS